MRIQGAGGGDASSGGVSEDPDTLSSVAFARFVDIIGEGPMVGLVNGDFSIYLDGVPLKSSEGTPNYKPFQSKTTSGTQSQLPIPGFSGTVSEVAVGVKLLKATGKVIRPISDSDADSVRVTVAVQGFTTTSDKGKIGPASVDYKISVRVEGGSWVSASNFTLAGKTTARYQRSHEITLSDLGPGPYEVAVERLTDDATSSLVVDGLYWDAYDTINYEPFSYPNTALVAVEMDGRYFSAVPQRAYHVRGLYIRVPSNYDPVTRTYSGIWDGTFKTAWSDNPAWCFYDLVTHRRYGLGKRITDAQISKWEIYTIGQYCDEPVPTGLTNNIFSTKHGSGFSSDFSIIAGAPVSRGAPGEPRFTLNCVINTKKDAYKVLNDLASVFRGMSYWGSGQVLLTQDRPEPPVIIWTNANVIDGTFTYEGSARADRHTTITVGWNDPAEDFRQRYEYVEDRDGIARYGVRQAETMAFGCTSRSQARRVGLWTLYTERIEKDAIKFRVGMDSANVRPGDIGKIMDNNRTGARWGGRILSATTSVVTLDAPVTLSAGTYTLSTMAQDGTLVEKAVNISVAGPLSSLTVSIPYGVAPATMALWTLASMTVVPMLARVITVTQVNSSQFDIVCLEHNPTKYDAIELGAAYEDYNYSFLTFDKVPSVTGLVVKENSFKTDVSSVVQTNMEIGWDMINDPLIRGYRVTVTATGGNVVEFPEQRDSFRTVLGVLPAIYTVDVYAVNQLGIVGIATTVIKQIIGIDTTPPSDVENFVSEALPDGGLRLTWDPNNEIDYLETELHFEHIWNDATPPLFVGRASSYTFASAPAGTYDVVAKHRDTSLNVSLNAAHVNDHVAGYVPPVDGEPGISFVISNEAHTLASDAFGNVPSFAGADTFISTYIGGVNSTDLWTYSKQDFNVHSYIDPLHANHIIVDGMGGTKLLLHSDDTAGALVPIDSSPGKHVVINPGSIVAEAASHSKFGMALPFDGSSTSYLEVAHDPEFELADKNFAIQTQVYLPIAPSVDEFIVGWWGQGTTTLEHSWRLRIAPDRTLIFDYSSLLDVSDFTVSSAATIPVGVVTEIGVSRLGNVLSLKVGSSVLSFPFDKTVRTILYDTLEVPSASSGPGTGGGTGTGTGAVDSSIHLQAESTEVLQTEDGDQLDIDIETNLQVESGEPLQAESADNIEIN